MERYTTDHLFHPWYEHWHRYHWVFSLVKDLRVADLACGEGYGSALLAQQAEHVTAVDIDAVTIEQAQKKYPNDNISFLCADVLNTGLQAAQFDCIVSFETLEHLTEHDALMLEFKRLLKPAGFLVISTPDKDIYNPQDQHNHHHVKELNQIEFNTLLAGHFKYQLMFGQQLQLGSVIEPLHNDEGDITLQAKVVRQGRELRGQTRSSRPQYLLAIVSDSEKCIEMITRHQGSWFNDSDNSLFQHFVRQIDRLQAADKRIPELEQQIQKQVAIINHLKARLGL